jgi:pectinesterase
MYACGIYGYQDTLYAKSGYQYYSRCYVEGMSYSAWQTFAFQMDNHQSFIGADDFIFGNAAAWFGDCKYTGSKSSPRF